jgi:hypothetical protein
MISANLEVIWEMSVDRHGLSLISTENTSAVWFFTTAGSLCAFPPLTKSSKSLGETKVATKTLS